MLALSVAALAEDTVRPAKIEDTLTGRFGKPGNYDALRNEAAYGHRIADSFFSLADDWSPLS